MNYKCYPTTPATLLETFLKDELNKICKSNYKKETDSDQLIQ